MGDARVDHSGERPRLVIGEQAAARRDQIERARSDEASDREKMDAILDLLAERP